MFRIGLGYDLHQTQDGDHIILGGEVIPAPFSLKGHSDADVLLHALTDAILGAIGDNDIGFYFSPNDSVNKGRSSSDFLLFANQQMKDQYYEIGNIDAVIICERPKISIYRSKIIAKLASLLNIDISLVNIKGKTNEKQDSIGSENSVAVHCVVLCKKIIQ